MIKTDETQTNLEFGTGDIGITSGSFSGECGENVGTITFRNQAPREIGTVGDTKVGQEYRLGDFPVIMTFYKKESIDVVIRALLDAKEQMD